MEFNTKHRSRGKKKKSISIMNIYIYDIKDS